MQLDLALVPEEPGVYQFFSSDGTLLYVGKAKNLRNRLGNYFHKNSNLHGRTRKMLSLADKVDWVVLASETEALMAEASIISNLQPVYNVKLKDERQLPWIAIDSRKEWPRVSIWYGNAPKGVKRFGPYLDRRTANEVMEAAIRIWPIRSCGDSKFLLHQTQQKPCMLGMIDRCSAPCTLGDQASVWGGDPPADFKGEYDMLVREFEALLRGESEQSVKRLTDSMELAAKDMKFEKAAKIRDRINLITRLRESQGVVTDSGANFDVVGFGIGAHLTVAQVLQIREGRLVAAPTFSLGEGEGEKDPIEATLEQFYLMQSSIPPLVVVEIVPENSAMLEDAIKTKFSKRIRFETRQQGEKFRLLEKAKTNAEGALRRMITRRDSDSVARTNTLAELQEALGLENLPRRIEAVDISHLNGIGTVSVISVMIDGVPKTSEYRNYRLADMGKPDDYASMKEVVGRRLDRARRELDSGQADKVPDLLLIDGGKGQLGVAVKELKKRDLYGVIPVISLAKREEEVFRPEIDEPLILPRDSATLYLLQYARDETHRAGNVYQKKLRKARLLDSELDSIPGLGKKRRVKLLQISGGVGKLRNWDDERWAKETWLPKNIQEAIKARINGADS